MSPAIPIALALGLVVAGVSTHSARAQGRGTQRAPTYLVIVNPSNPVAELPRAEAAAYFLKRRTTWSTGVPVAPVDLPPDATARLDFSAEVLVQSPKAVNTYWIQEIFAGRAVPPPVKSTPTAVVAFVASTLGAIGYVPGDTPTTGVRVVRVTP